MAILETEKLTYIYHPKTAERKTAVDQVDLSIREGEIVGIIGETGSGKSTLVQQFNGLLRPTSGRVLLRGRNIWEKPKEIRKIRFQIGMVFQYPEYQLFEETLEKDVAFGPKNQGLEQGQITQRVRDAFDFVGLDWALRSKSPFELSGGEKRRAAIAGVIAMDPDILILDEPTAGLDPQGRRFLLDRLQDYHRRRNNTILFVSHCMEDVARLADRVLVMQQGRVLMFDAAGKVFSRRAELEQAGLKVPQITEIVSGLADRGIPVSRELYTVPDAAQAILRLFGKGGAG